MQLFIVTLKKKNKKSAVLRALLMGAVALLCIMFFFADTLLCCVVLCCAVLCVWFNFNSPRQKIEDRNKQHSHTIGTPLPPPPQLHLAARKNGHASMVELLVVLFEKGCLD